MEVTLQPAAFFEAVNVTSSRTNTARVDPTSTVTVISSSDLLTGGPLAIDDALKTIPGFTLFRRTSSRNSNPTSQGVALRGIGGTSPSRSLVLADGVPLNDAFGGWVFWDKVPQAAIDRMTREQGYMVRRALKEFGEYERTGKLSGAVPDSTGEGDFGSVELAP